MPSLPASVKDVVLGDHPDLNLPVFPYEDHLNCIKDEHKWPCSTRRESHVRLQVTSEGGVFGDRTTIFDIVDYPGERLLDLPLLTKNYEEWSTEAIATARLPERMSISADWLNCIESMDIDKKFTEHEIMECFEKYVTYLYNCKEEGFSDVSTGFQALLDPKIVKRDPPASGQVFFPLIVNSEANRGDSDSIFHRLESRFEHYKSTEIIDFHKNYIRSVDSMIVLIDAMHILEDYNRLIDLEASLTKILGMFKPTSIWEDILDIISDPIEILYWILGRSVKKVLFAVVKSDHVPNHEEDHLKELLDRFLQKISSEHGIKFNQVETMVISSVICTEETSPGILQGRLMPDGDLKRVKQVRVPDCQEFRSDDKRSFAKFLPESRQYGPTEPFPHIRLDEAFSYLVEDFL